jgi:biopolymer transport protein ExbD
MSRARHAAEQNAVQLFPFVAVLLCTMGSLMVLLVVIARSARVHAIEAAAATRAAAAAKSALTPAQELAAKKKLAQIADFQSQLDTIRQQATEKLRQDQLRLSHLEDHMQRLRDQLGSLQLAAAELNSLEGEHYDDRQQAEREIERLQQLIAESRKTIDELRAEMRQRPKSYAIVPYQGRQGTSRRPIYIECRANDVILQPEGVKLTIDDFRPPIGPGNPLVAALRAAREYIHRTESNAAAGKEAEPYPLIIVRPNGIEFYYRVREAIQSWDSEFGYELVEENWELKYAPADPQLASLEYQAAELARNRLQALAAAAPRAYGAYRSSGDDYQFNGDAPRYVSHGNGLATSRRGTGGDFATSEREGYGAPSGGAPPGEPGRGIGAEGTGSAGEYGEFGVGGGGQPGDSLAEEMVVGQAGGNRTLSGGSTSGTSGNGTSSSAAPSTATEQATDDRYATAEPPPSASQVASGSASSMGEAGEPSPHAAAGSARASADADAEQQLDRMARQAAADDGENRNQPRRATKARGANWAIASAGPGMIPIRRTIQVVIRADAVAVLDEQSASNPATATGREFQFHDSPEVAYEEALTAIEAKIKDWGIAGDGLYWRPVVELKVGSGGERRTNDWLRLLKNGGFEVRNNSVARQDEGGASGTNR